MLKLKTGKQLPAAKDLPENSLFMLDCSDQRLPGKPYVIKNGVWQEILMAKFSHDEAKEECHMTAEEHRTRIDLAACYRLVAHYGWSDLIFNHISARIPGTNEFLINPYGWLFEEITASSLIKIDLKGNRIDHVNNHLPINPAGFNIHSAIHEAREDAMCVLHVHSANGSAVSAQKNGLLPISQQAMFVLSSLGYHDYEGVVLNEEEKPRLVNNLADNDYFMLRNHGLLTVGPTIADAFLNMYTFETACAIQIRAQAGGELTHIDDSLIANAKAQNKIATKFQGGMLAWPALLRKVAKIDGSFRN